MNSGVFITGGSGLLALNWAVTIRDRFNVIMGIHEREIRLKNAQTHILDIASIDSVERVFDQLRPQVVIHTAGLTDVDRCESEPDLAKHVNVKIATNIAIACAKLKLPLVHISTDHLFHGDKSLVDEEFPVSPVNVYGRTKAEAEKLVLENYPEALVVRTNFYGWGTKYRRSFSDMVISSLRLREEITLFNDVHYTPLIAEELVLSVHELVNKKASGIFNVVGDDRISKYEFGLKLAKEFNLDSSLIKKGYIADHKALVQRPHDMSLSNQKITRFLDRKIGGVDKHLARLNLQEKNGLAQELQNL